MGRGGNKQQFGDWQVQGTLGSGGMGVVYDTVRRDGRRAALKVVNPALANDPKFRTRFRREIDVSRRVTGPRTAAVLDADPDGDPPWFATEFVHGPTLAEAVARNGPIHGDALTSLAIALLQALDEIHTVGVVHRDLKPSNVILTADTPKVIDFGIALSEEATSLTATGAFIGSPGWMSPEQVRGNEVTPASDVFSWAALVAYAGTGRPPFGGGRPDAIAYRIVHEEPDLDGVPPALLASVRQGLRIEPTERPAPRTLVSELTSGSDPTATVAEGWATVPATVVDPPDRTTVGRTDVFLRTPARPVRRHSWLWASAVALVVLVAGALAAIGLARRDDPNTTSSTDTSELAATSSTTTATTAPSTTTPAPAEPLFEGRYDAATSEALELLDFAEKHKQEVVRIDAALDGLEPDDLTRVDEGTHVLFVPGTCDQFCEGDAYELLFNDLDSVSDASVFYDSGAIEINGRFVVNNVQIQTGGIFSIALRSLPIAEQASPTDAAAEGASLVGTTDDDRSHWKESGEEPQDFNLRLIGEEIGVFPDFPVTMNGCGTRQLRVSWRTVGESEVISGYKFFTDPPTTEWQPDEEADPAAEGTMVLSGCEEPTFRNRPANSTTDEGGSVITDIVATVGVYAPTA